MLSEFRYILFSIILLISLHTFSQRVTEVQIEKTDSLVYNKEINEDLRKLIGHVQFRHNNDLMFCDSAYYYKSINSFEAFGKIHVIHNDTVELFGNYMKYNGDIRFGQVRKNVKLLDKNMTLLTQSLDFDLENDFAYYDNNGTINDTSNTLVSKNGYYFFNTKEFFFKGNVVLTNKKYVMKSDTLKYNTQTDIASFYGPTTIVSDSNYIYCERGWYNTKINISQLNKNVLLKNKKQTLKGDSIYYERNNAFGRAFKNVELIDSVENIILRGNIAYYNEKIDSSLLTDNALLIVISEDDSLFLHADTLRSNLDSTKKYKVINAYHQVKYYRNDMQGKCDSLVYSFTDSIIRLYKEPVLWSEENQLTADYIQILTKKNRAEKIELRNAAFIIAQEDTIHFNQITGKNMTGFIKNNKLFKVNVDGNGQTIYYAKDGNQMIGINKAASSNLIIYLDKGKVNKINFIQQPDATLNPPHQLKNDDLILKGFKWLGNIRPKNKNEVY